jgi:NDP-sugar pyrophosphorylase family protein
LPADCLQGIDAVILAGGMGTRLRSVLPDSPKCLAPIAGVPFLRRYMCWLQRFGLRRVILSLGYKADLVQAYLSSETWPGLEIVTSVESLPLGTGGALRAVLPLVNSQTVLVANGDSFTGVNACEFVSFHKKKNARVSMLLTKHEESTASGRVETDKNDAVTSFSEKPPGASNEPAYINAGMYLMEREAILEIPLDKPVSLECDIFPGLCDRHFFALKGAFPFIDIGTPESFRIAGEFFASRIDTPDRNDTLSIK